MKKHKLIHKILGTILIICGFLLYPTPVPGTTLMILIGFVWFIGEKKTIESFKHVLSHKAFKFLKIKKIVEEI